MAPPQDIWHLLYPSSYLGSGRSTFQWWGVAERPLPEAGIAGRNVQVAGLVGEVFRARAVFPAQVPRVKSPPVQHGQPAAGVAQRCRQQNRPVLLLRDRLSATEQHVIAALEIDLLRAIVQLRWNEQRAEPRHQGALGNAGGSVRRAHRGERG